MAKSYEFDSDDFNSINTSGNRFVSPVPVHLCHKDWAENYKLYILLEAEQQSHQKFLEDLRAKYHRLKWARHSPYFGAMKIRGIVTSCRNLWKKKMHARNESNKLLSWLFRHDCTTGQEYPPATVQEEDEDYPDNFDMWLQG